MKKARSIAKTDGNHSDIARIFLQAGATWFDTHTIPGELDGVVGYAGIDQRVEIKDPAQSKSARKLTDAEGTCFETWRGRPPAIVETVDDCIALLQKMRRDSNQRGRR